MFGLHAAHVGTAVSLVTIIVVSLATRPEYKKFEETSWVALGREIKENLPEMRIPEGENKIFGWLGAKTPGVKALWTLSFVGFVLHYILIALFKMPASGHILTWLTLAACIILPLMLAILGAKDVRSMIKDAAEARAKIAEQKKA